MLGTDARSPLSLSYAQRERLCARLRQARMRARDGGPALATLTIGVAAELDPTAVVCASRRPGEPWFSFEKPDADLPLYCLIAKVNYAGGEPDSYILPLMLLDEDAARALERSRRPKVSM